jgi:hypothetical protein
MELTLKVVELSLIKERIPKNPTIKAGYRRHPTFSPSITTDKIGIISGAELQIESTSASGRAVNPLK